MKTLSYEEACRRDFSVNAVFAMRQTWHTRHGFSYETVPRPDHGILICIKGEVEYTRGGVSLALLSAGDIIYLPKGSHYYASMRSVGENILINFELKDSQNREFRLHDDVFKMAEGKLSMYAPSFQNILKTGESGSFHTARLKARLLSLLEELFLSNFEKQENTEEKHRKISAVVLQLENNPTQNISVPEMAKSCALCETTFRRQFREYTGLSPVQYVNRLKIERARQMLLTSEVTVEYICEQLNFYDASYFNKLFKSYTGVSPSQYKMEARNK